MKGLRDVARLEKSASHMRSLTVPHLPALLDGAMVYTHCHFGRLPVVEQLPELQSLLNLIALRGWG
jgi:hypothetical protein